LTLSQRHLQAVANPLETFTEVTMREEIDAMLRNYERGKVSRRTVVQGLVALLATPSLPLTSPSTSVFRAKNLNHVTLAASNLERTRDFYERILGLSFHNLDEKGFFFGVGNQTIGVDLASSANEKVGIDHFCVGVDGFEAD
jgi:hypothetical protein